MDNIDNKTYEIHEEKSQGGAPKKQGVKIALRVLSIIAGIIFTLTVIWCVSVLVDIINSFDPESGHTLGNLGYVFVLIFGLVGVGITGLLSVPGLVLAIVKKEAFFIVFFSVLLALAIFFILFILVVGPTMLPSLHTLVPIL